MNVRLSLVSLDHDFANLPDGKTVEMVVDGAGFGCAIELPDGGGYLGVYVEATADRLTQRDILRFPSERAANPSRPTTKSS
jgi:hypothetical protein